ncbi:MAG: antibiotic biosynthesis monooxygenase family protein [Steroidobacteraceae bacterium]
MRIRVVVLSVALLGLVSVAEAQAPSASAPAGRSAMAMVRRPSTATTFVVQFKVKPGQNAAFEAAFRRMEAKVGANEPGNLSYELYRNGQPQTYVIIERYKDLAAVAAHRRDAQNLMSDLRDSLDGAPTFQGLTLVSSK